VWNTVHEFFGIGRHGTSSVLLLLLLGAFERRLVAFEGHVGWFYYLVTTDNKG
jgi:hypothetical protein